MPLILAFDTATKHCAVALCEDGHVIAQRTDDSERYSHAERLNVFVKEVLAEAGRDLSALEAVAVGIGPGSYTGLRIGLSAAKGFVFALDIPLIALSSLVVLEHEVMAVIGRSASTPQLHPMIDARRMEVFTRSAAEPEAISSLILGDDWCAGLEMGTANVVFGDGADKAAELWSRYAHIQHLPGVKPSVRGLCVAATLAHQAGMFADAASLTPNYAKEANVTKAKG